MKYIFLTLISFISILGLKINLGLYAGNYSLAQKKTDIILQLNFLESELKNNKLGERMQQMFPEGYVFIHALYGLSWCELALSSVENDQAVKKIALQEALYAYNAINSEEAKQIFDNNLVPENGIYYFGWKNYLLSKILSLDTTFENHESYVNSFVKQCNILNHILKESKVPYLSSYPDQTWPADMFVAIASLSNYDKIFKPNYKTEINNWLDKVKGKLDPVTHLIPHQVDTKTCNVVQGARGCSMSLMLRMLGEINTDFANEQFKIFKTNFVSTAFGLPFLREYPKGQHGFGDIDSGPVIFGVGFSGTIVMIGTFSMFNCGNLAEQQYKTIHAFGFSTIKRNQKKYLFGNLPMADAFIAWGRATGLNVNDASIDSDRYWRIKFHFISFLIITLFWITYFRKKLIKKLKSV